ncbi:MAG: Gfo/Idh/MocA family oxidoreductase [Spartobacteria bacterium]|nr:Gfo/Idh/MocA family oxidoreductase [Spartobacteria bacterium]
MKNMKFGIIGFGKMGQKRQTLIENSGHRVIAVFDPEFTGEKGLHPAKNAEEIINNPEVDAVCVCGPNFVISDTVVKALDAGKHVFSEKPPGRTMDEVLAMKTAAERHPELKLKFGFNHRYHDAVIEAKNRIESGKFGSILWMRGRYGKSVDEDFKKTWRADKEKAGGGILLDQGIHMLDLFTHFCGDFQQVKAFADKQYWDLGIEDNVFAIFRNEQGQTASLHSTMTQWRHLFALEIFLERGYMVINGILSSTGSYTNGTGKEELSISLNRTPAPMAKHSQEERMVFSDDVSFQREIDEFIDCIQHNKPVVEGDIQDALRIMNLIDMVYKDSAT